MHPTRHTLHPAVPVFHRSRVISDNWRVMKAQDSFRATLPRHTFAYCMVCHWRTRAGHDAPQSLAKKAVGAAPLHLAAIACFAPSSRWSWGTGQVNRAPLNTFLGGCSLFCGSSRVPEQLTGNPLNAKLPV